MRRALRDSEGHESEDAPKDLKNCQHVKVDGVRGEDDGSW